MYLCIYIYSYIFTNICTIFSCFFKLAPASNKHQSIFNLTPTTMIFNPSHISITSHSSFYIRLHTYLQIHVLFCPFLSQPPSDSKPTPTQHQSNSTPHTSVLLFTHPCTYIFNTYLQICTFFFVFFLRLTCNSKPTPTTIIFNPSHISIIRTHT